MNVELHSVACSVRLIPFTAFDEEICQRALTFSLANICNANEHDICFANFTRVNSDSFFCSKAKI